VFGWEQVRKEGIPFERKWKPDSWAVNTRMIVRDTHTGAYGTLDIPLESLVAKASQPTG